MGKSKRRKLQNQPPKKAGGEQRAAARPDRAKATEAKKPQQQQAAHAQPTIPFDPNDRILLIGEGDFSFSRSLVEHHGCAELTATCYDSESSLLSKYPQSKETIEYILSEDQHVLYGVDATKMTQKELRKGARWDRILFNFPHVGGKSTDVNRQVRYNQELVVGFFLAASPLLSPDGNLVVTLFEGEPYTLWNIRDLARHTGLEVVRSFKFQADAYPGYSHARTLGNIEGGGGWKGESRAARSYVFRAKQQEQERSKKQDTATPKKRKRGGDESSDDYD